MGKVKTSKLAQVALLGTACLLASSYSQAELALAVQPNAPKADDPSFYHDFAETLTELLEEKVTYMPEKSWSVFRKQLMANSYDILIAESHLTALLTLNTGNGGLDYSVLAAIPDQITYKVVTTANSELSSLKDLNGKHVCTPLSPGLAAVAFLNQYRNDPVNPPLVLESKKGVERSYESMIKKRCQAVVMTGLEFEKLKITADDLVTIYETREFPGWALNFSPVHTGERREQITNLMTSMQSPVVQDLYQALSTQAGGFVDKDKSDYVGYNILPGVVWGW